MGTPPTVGTRVHKVIVAGFGNVLRRDDGFGVAVVEELARHHVPDGVQLMDVGIMGIHLGQQLGDEVAGLVVLDAVEVGRPAGTVVVVDPEVEDVSRMSVMDRRDHLADMHYATPDRALMLAGAMGVLPPATVVIGCQPTDVDTYAHGLTPPVAHAVPVAADEVRRAVTGMGVAWPLRSVAG
jgi:hydrogenase maturation protease